MKKKNWISIAFAVCLVVGYFLLIVVSMRSNVERVAINSETLTDFNSAWRVFVDGQFVGEHDMPCKIDAPENSTVRIEKQLPADLKQNSTLFFTSRHSSVRIYTSDELLYSFGYDAPPPIGATPGNGWQIVRIPPADFGDMVAIETVSPYAPYSGDFSNFYIGTKAAILFSILEDRFIPALLASLILAAGVAMLLMVTIAKGTAMHDSLLYLGLFAILLGIWSIGESKILQLWIGNSLFYTNLVFITLYLMPVPFLLFLRSLDCFKTDKILQGFIVAFLGNFALVNVLQVCNVVDYFEMLLTVHTLIVSTSMYILYQFVRHRKDKAFADLRMIVRFVTVMVLMTVLAVVLFYFGLIERSIVITSFGFLVFVLLLCSWAARKVISNYSARIEREALQALAYKDVLTGLANRAAFEEEMDSYRVGKKEEAVLVALDLNDLKRINDTYSHRAGDAALVSAAGYIREFFTDIGKCYRIGGDEFCVICTGVAQNDIAQTAQEMAEAMASANKAREIPVELAYGVSRYARGVSSVDDAMNFADKQMYVCKARMKASR